MRRLAMVAPHHYSKMVATVRAQMQACPHRGPSLRVTRYLAAVIRSEGSRSETSLCIFRRSQGPFLRLTPSGCRQVAELAKGFG